MACRVGNPHADQLAAGETVLALASCAPPGAIERQSARPIRIVVTDQRFLALKTNRMTGRSKGDVELEIPLRDVISVRTKKRHPVAALGMPIFTVAVALLSGEVLVFETSGIGIKALRHFADVLESAAQAVPESKYGASVQGPDVEAFNLLHVNECCTNCGNDVDRVLEFFYGKRAQVHYALGDTVAWWPEPDWNEGGPVQGRAWLPSDSDQCPGCGYEASFADFAIVIDGSRLVSVVQAPPGQRFRDDIGVVPLNGDDEPQWEPEPRST